MLWRNMLHDDPEGRMKNLFPGRAGAAGDDRPNYPGPPKGPQTASPGSWQQQPRYAVVPDWPSEALCTTAYQTFCLNFCTGFAIW